MNIIVVGAGRIGFHLARILVEEGCEVTVVDKDGDICEDIGRELECGVVHGDATKPRVLEEAGVREADSIVALSGSDETNLVVCLLAKQLGAKQVAARLASLHYDEVMLKNLGLDLVIYPEAAAAGYISELITKPEVLDLAFIARGNAEIVEVEVKPDSPIVGQKIKDIENPQGAGIIALLEDNHVKIPDPETKIKEGDRVLILARSEKIKEIRKLVG